MDRVPAVKAFFFVEKIQITNNVAHILPQQYSERNGFFAAQKNRKNRKASTLSPFVAIPVKIADLGRMDDPGTKTNALGFRGPMSVRRLIWKKRQRLPTGFEAIS